MPNPLVNIGDLAKPATVLVEKISDVIGGALKPCQIIRVAKAEAKVEKIRAESEIEVNDIRRQAMDRFLDGEVIRQGNIDGIIQKALPSLNKDAKSEDVENDWLAYFFDKCKIVSDQEMQILWSKVLSGEANAPGTFSKRTVSFLSDLDKNDAHMFTKLCGFGWNIVGDDPSDIEDLFPVILNYEHNIYAKYGIDFDALSHLESIGLIHFTPNGEYQRIEIPKKFSVLYFGQSFECEMVSDVGYIDHGKVMLTKIGKELAAICGSKPVSGFKEYVLEEWRSKFYLKSVGGS